MKLTDQQKHYVHRYLERQKFKTQEFFDESYDHLICHLENQISNGASFLSTLEKYDKSIKGEKYKYGIFVFSTGWKALEHQFINTKKVNLTETQQSFFKAQIFTYRFFIWLFLATLYWYLMKADYLIVHIVLLMSIIIAGIIVPFFDKELRQDALKWPKPIKNFEKWYVARDYKAGLALLILSYFAGKFHLKSVVIGKNEFVFEVIQFAVIFGVLIIQVSKLEMFYQLKNRKTLKKQHI
ncbi:hypothetical protein MCERE19_02814 [Spirosomataceae bacterium]|jgi:hypothetical protein